MRNYRRSKPEILVEWRAARTAVQRRAERYALAERTARSRGDAAAAEAERIRRQEAEWDVADLNVAIPRLMVENVTLSWTTSGLR